MDIVKASDVNENKIWYHLRKLFLSLFRKQRDDKQGNNNKMKRKHTKETKEKRKLVYFFKGEG
jgi:hypothetical protein